ncbi:hypothetical protein Ciccas_003461 [Cichlidogyrus casuarinus]|uniref:C2 domain-containing protein n=1 Tax=Cichlidogyrus casuarinus TaxID=1844966 RepID=A0ABD2QED8_9PLAT
MDLFQGSAGAMGSSAGDIDGNRDSQSLGGVQLRKRNINYSNKPQDFQVRVKIVEARQIQGANIDPVCKVELFEERKQTRIIKGSNSPQFNQIFYFNVNKSPAQLVDEMITLSVFNSQMVRYDSLIGSFKFDLGLVYEQDKHALLNRWLLLSDPEDPMAGPKGYLKISVLVLGPGDEAVTSGEEEDIEANLLKPAGVTLRAAVYEINIYSAEELPRMDAGIMSKLNPFSKNTESNFVDPFVLVNFAGKEIKTKILNGTDNPLWNENLTLNVMDLNLGKAPGVAYRGRVLLELNTKFVEEHSTETSKPISNDDQARVKKFMRKRHYVLHGIVMSANMLASTDAPIQFEISIGNYGNILEDRVAPAASTTPPTNAVFDGKYYHFLPYAKEKPTILVDAQLEDISVRLFALNQLIKLQDNFVGLLSTFSTFKFTE